MRGSQPAGSADAPDELTHNVSRPPEAADEHDRPGQRQWQRAERLAEHERSATRTIIVH